MKLPVGFVDGVEQVGEDDAGLDYATMANPLWAARLRFWITSSNENAVESCLNPAAYKLESVIVWSMKVPQSVIRTFGRKYQPA